MNNEVETINASLKQVGTQLKAYKESTESSIAEISARIANVEQVVAKQESMGEGVTAYHANPFGSQVAASDQVESLKARNTDKAVVTLENVSLYAAITGDPDSSGHSIVAPQRREGIIPGATRRLRIRDLIPMLPATSNKVSQLRETEFDNGAQGQTVEGELKGESSFTFESQEVPVVTIAHFTKASEQVLDDAEALTRFLDTRMRYGVLVREEEQILSGSGLAGNLSGLRLPENHTTYNGGYESDDTKIDILRKAIAQLQAADYEATGIVLNTKDWESIERIKDAEGRYIFAKPQEASAPQMWGVPVVPTNSMEEGEFIVADFTKAATLWDRMAPTVQIGRIDDQFVKNMVTIRAEERVALTVDIPEAVIVGTFDQPSA